METKHAREESLGKIIKEIRDSGAETVVYGANCQLTELTLHALERFGIKPACLADGRLEYDGREMHGLPVISPDKLVADHPGAHVFICLTREFWTVRDMLWERGKGNLHDVAALLAEVPISDPMFGKTASFLVTARDTHARLVETRTGGVSLPFANFIVTERCSLNCRACNNSMPLIKHKLDYAADDLLLYARRITDALDVLVSGTIIGGEPFLYTELPRIIRGLSAFDKITKVEVVTNGTLIPREDIVEAMRGTPKVHVTISKYPTVKQRIPELTALLEDNGIPCDLGNYTEWKDMGDMSNRGRNLTQMVEVFRNCTLKNCPSILGGKLYHCSRAAFGARLGFVPTAADEVVPLDDPTLSGEDIRERVRKVFFNRKTLAACNFCDGGDVASPAIIAALQQ